MWLWDNKYILNTNGFSKARRASDSGEKAIRFLREHKGK